MNIKFKHIPDTDMFYDVIANGERIGEVRKVYTGRSAAGVWTIYPDGYPKDRKMRLCYPTRREAGFALVDFCRAPHKHSLVEG